jgi:hypothetical protein
MFLCSNYWCNLFLCYFKIKGAIFILHFALEKLPNTACTGQVRAFARTFGESAPTADSASGGFIRQIPPLPVTPAVGQVIPKGNTWIKTN